MIPIFVGYDKREAVAYHTFCQSVIESTRARVSFTPITGDQRDGSNSFIYERFMVPYLMKFKGWAIFADGDMVCKANIEELWNMRDDRYAVMVAKHDYKTKFPVKYLGAKNEDYPRKNWSSVILWNCSHESNYVLTPSYVHEASGKMLHRFQHLADFEIGEIPLEWNWLTSEYEPNAKAKLLHYTIGTPCFPEYKDSDMANHWWWSYRNACKPL